MFYVAVLFACITVSAAQSAEDVDPNNVITVPPNCPPGQEWVNGACRDIWTWRNNPSAANLGVIDPSWRNVITVPANCPPGQELINGICRDVWRFFKPTTPLPKNNENSDPSSRNVITVPANCPPGQQLINGVCRDVWRFFGPTTPLPKKIEISDSEMRDRRQTDTEVDIETPDIENRNIINVPKQCPIGYKPDALGICRQILIYV